MNRFTKTLETHPKLRQWLWFIGLWCGGFLAMAALAAPIKLLIRLAQ